MHTNYNKTIMPAVLYCSVFGCGKILTLKENLCGSRCIKHSYETKSIKKIVYKIYVNQIFCLTFGCGKKLTLQETLCGSRCIKHSKEKARVMHYEGLFENKSIKRAEGIKKITFVEQSKQIEAEYYCCSVFGCGKVLTLEENLSGSKCVKHSNKAKKNVAKLIKI